METKDWILLLVPIVFDGALIFILQKLFEKRQKKQRIQNYYLDTLRKNIDVALSLHAKATRLANDSYSDDQEILNTLNLYINSCLDVYYYYVQNKNTFIFLEKDINELSSTIMSLANYVNNSEESKDNMKICMKINTIRDILMTIKDDCIKF